MLQVRTGRTLCQGMPEFGRAATVSPNQTTIPSKKGFTSQVTSQEQLKVTFRQRIGQEEQEVGKQESKFGEEQPGTQEKCQLTLEVKILISHEP